MDSTDLAVEKNSDLHQPSFSRFLCILHMVSAERQVMHIERIVVSHLVDIYISLLSVPPKNDARCIPLK